MNADLLRVLDRRAPIDSLGALISALTPSTLEVSLNRTAISLDTNVFLRLNKELDIIDYLGEQHAGPLILPGQAVQEFWNNQLNVMQSMAKPLGDKFNALKTEMARTGEVIGEYAEKIDALIKGLSGEYGHILDPNTLTSVRALLDVFSKKAIVPYAPRMLFHEIAVHRKMTKTPPGFKDDGDGDFFVWVDLLTGLQRLKSAGVEFDKIVLVNRDSKIDWSRGGIAHPILVAEARALLGVPFEIWTIEDLKKAIAEST